MRGLKILKTPCHFDPEFIRGRNLNCAVGKGSNLWRGITIRGRSSPGCLPDVAELGEADTGNPAGRSYFRLVPPR